MTAPRALLTNPHPVRDTTTSSDTAAASSVELVDLPHIEDPGAVAPADARELSRALLARLGRLEEGTAEYSYVRGTLIELNVSLVKYAARRFQSPSELMDDIIQVGIIGLIKAIDRFEADRGLEFTTFALPTIIGEIKRHFRDSTWAVHVPRRLQELRLSLAKASDELEQRLDRAPTVAELAVHLAVSEEEVVEGLTASNGYRAGSLDMQLESDSPDSALARRLGFDDTRLTRFEDLHALKPLLAALSERDRSIISMRFGEELTQAQIGQRLGLSQMHVSRLLARSLAVLRAGLLQDDRPMAHRLNGTGQEPRGARSTAPARGGSGSMSRVFHTTEATFDGWCDEVRGRSAAAEPAGVRPGSGGRARVAPAARRPDGGA